jgi:fatty acid desaturase
VSEPLDYVTDRVYQEKRRRAVRTLGVVVGWLIAALIYVAVSLALLGLSVWVVVWVLQKMGVLE